MLTLPKAAKLLGVSKPTARKAFDALQQVRILIEITGILLEATRAKRDRVYAYHANLQIVTQDTG